MATVAPTMPNLSISTEDALQGFPSSAPPASSAPTMSPLHLLEFAPTGAAPVAATAIATRPDPDQNSLSLVRPHPILRPPTPVIVAAPSDPTTSYHRPSDPSSSSSSSPCPTNPPMDMPTAPSSPATSAASDPHVNRVSNPGATSTAASPAAAAGMGLDESAVLTPSRLRLDSRVVAAHATLQWLANAVWAVLIWMKLEGRLRCSWRGVFAPTLAAHMVHIPVQLAVLAAAGPMIVLQLGPPPPATASVGLQLQYGLLAAVRRRSHMVDWCNSCLESLALMASKAFFCAALEGGRLGTTPLRLIFTPIWITWVLSVVLLCLKDRSERMFGSSRDLLFIFLLFVALKVDEQSTYSWRVVFLVPWVWFSGLLLVATLVLVLLLLSRVWARPRELLLPLGFCALLLATTPQFLSYIALVKRLDGDTSVSVQSILLPNALSWAAMWIAGLVIAHALRARELARAALAARGAVWTAHEGLARRLGAERQEAQRRVDQLSESEISRMVEAMMAGKTKPGGLRRVGATLYTRIASLEPGLAGGAGGAGAGAGGVGAGLQLDAVTGGLRSNRVAPLPPGMALPEAGRERGEAAVAAAAWAGAAEAGLESARGTSGSFRIPAHRAAPPGPRASPTVTPARPSTAPLTRAGAGLGAGGAAAAPAPRLRPAPPLPPLSAPHRGSSGDSAGTGSSANGADITVASVASSMHVASGARGGGGSGGEPASPPRQVWRSFSAAQHSSASLISRTAAEAGGGQVGGCSTPRPHSQPQWQSPASAAAATHGGDPWVGQGAAAVPGPGSAAAGPGATAAAPQGSADHGPGWPSAATASVPALAPGADPAGVSSERGTDALQGGAGLRGAQPRAPAALPGEQPMEADDAATAGPGGGSAVAAADPLAALAAASTETPGRRDAAEPPAGEGAAGAACGGTPGAALAAGSEAGPAAVPAAGAAGGDGGSDDGDDLCVICYDAQATCVFLECGHGGFCRRCAHLLFVRPPNECPACRQVIDQVVEVEEAPAVGQVARVK